MLESLISVAFWILVPFAVLVVAVCAARIGARSAALGLARHDVDDGSDDPKSLSAFAMSRASGRLSTLAWTALAAAFLVVLSGVDAGPIMRLVAVLAASMVVLAADELQRRHDRLESRFAALAGRTVDEICARMRGRREDISESRAS